MIIERAFCVVNIVDLSIFPVKMNLQVLGGCEPPALNIPLMIDVWPRHTSRALRQHSKIKGVYYGKTFCLLLLF